MKTLFPILILVSLVLIPSHALDTAAAKEHVKKHVKGRQEYLDTPGLLDEELLMMPDQNVGFRKNKYKNTVKNVLLQHGGETMNKNELQDIQAIKEMLLREDFGKKLKHEKAKARKNALREAIESSGMNDQTKMLIGISTGAITLLAVVVIVGLLLYTRKSDVPQETTTEKKSYSSKTDEQRAKRGVFSFRRGGQGQESGNATDPSGHTEPFEPYQHGGKQEAGGMSTEDTESSSRKNLKYHSKYQRGGEATEIHGRRRSSRTSAYRSIERVERGSRGAKGSRSSRRDRELSPSDDDDSFEHHRQRGYEYCKLSRAKEAKKRSAGGGTKRRAK